MRLARTINLIRSRTTCTRSYSTSFGVPEYSSKVRAFPFATSPQDVITRLSLIVSTLTAGKGLLDSIGATLLPGAGFKPIQPKRFQPVYVPAWSVTTELEAKAWIQKKGQNETVQDTVLTHIYNGYMPGVTWDPLSRLPLRGALDSSPEEAVPFTEELAKQHNTDILCLPYNVTPFSLVNAAKSLSYRDSVISEDLRFEPGTLKSHSMAAFPVLVPVYLAQYSVQFDENFPAFELEAIVEAYKPKGLVITTNLLNEVLRVYKPSSEIVNRMNSMISGDRHMEFFWLENWLMSASKVPSFAEVQYVSVDQQMSERAQEIEDWIQTFTSQRGALEQYQQFEKSKRIAAGENPDVINFEDPRIREFTWDEISGFGNYLAYSTRIKAMENLISGISSIVGTGGEHTSSHMIRIDLGNDKGKKVEHLGADKMMEEMTSSLDNMKQQQEESKPQWLKESDKKNSRTTDSDRGGGQSNSS